MRAGKLGLKLTSKLPVAATGPCNGAELTPYPPPLLPQALCSGGQALKRPGDLTPA